jgi:hypothetical protein
VSVSRCILIIRITITSILQPNLCKESKFLSQFPSTQPAQVYLVALVALARPTASSLPPPLPEVVSMVQLIATPEKFDGQEILVAGFLRLEFEGNCLYLHREDYEHLISKNAIWIVRNPVINAQRNALNMHYVVLMGTFNATRKGHLSLNSGSLTDITGARLSVRP